MQLDREMHKIITRAVESAAKTVGMAQLRIAFSGAPTQNPEKGNGPVPPIV